MPYRVMRCVTDAGFETHVLGTVESTAWRLARSRYCHSLECVPVREFATGTAVERVNALAREHGSHMIFAADPDTTRFLAWHGHAIKVEHFPVLDATTFERLINKDGFALVCQELNLPHPQTWISSTPEQALAVLDAHPTSALIVKPVDAHASKGVWKVEPGDPHARARLASVPYRPILVQEFIEGCDLNALLLFDKGNIVASIAYQLGQDEFQILEDEDVMQLMQRLSGALQLHGPVGFDMRRDHQGRLWLLECNPRFTHEGSLMCFLSDYSIIKAHLSRGAVPFRAPASTLHRAKLLRPWTLVANDRRHTTYLLNDAYPNFMQACREFYKLKIRQLA